MPSRTVTGQVAQVSTKPWTDKRGNTINLYSFQLEGSNQWFRTGTTPIAAGVGQSVKFVADGANVDMESFAVVASQVSTSPAVATTTATTSSGVPSTATAASSAGLTNSGYWDRKDQRDIEKDARYQAVSEPRMALSVAVEAAAPIVQTALAHDALSFGNATKAKRVGILTAYTKEIALELAAFIQNAPAELEAYKASIKTGAVASSAADTGTVSE